MDFYRRVLQNPIPEYKRIVPIKEPDSITFEVYHRLKYHTIIVEEKACKVEFYEIYVDGRKRLLHFSKVRNSLYQISYREYRYLNIDLDLDVVDSILKGLGSEPHYEEASLAMCYCHLPEDIVQVRSFTYV